VAAPASEIASRLQAQFGAHVSLSGYTLAAATLAPGDILQITLFWQTDAALTERRRDRTNSGGRYRFLTPGAACGLYSY